MRPRVSRPLAEYYSDTMTNRFGLDLPPDRLRWAAAEGVSEDVIAAVLLLHDRSVDEIGPQLSAAELEKVIVLVGRSPRLYERGTLEALEERRSLLLPTPSAGNLSPNAAPKDKTISAGRPRPPRTSSAPSGANVPQNAPETNGGGPATRLKPDAD
jgi:hypothetical protein